MAPLIDLWAANGTFPKTSKAYGMANIKAGERLLQIAGVTHRRMGLLDGIHGGNLV